MANNVSSPHGIPKRISPQAGGEAQNETGRQARDIARGKDSADLETQDDRNERHENPIGEFVKEKL